MSGKPISAGDDLDLASALAAGWSMTEVEWEVKTENAAALAFADRETDAAALWREALDLARDTFAAQDPRLGTSLANAAYALRGAGNDKAAAALFEESCRVWDASALWVAGMIVEHRARSSLFHLRMEAKHRDTYEAVVRKRLGRFAEEARGAVRALAAGDPPPVRLFERWRGEKPAVFGDSRRLLAACLLLVSRPS